MRNRRVLLAHLGVLLFAIPTMTPFYFVIVNSFRSNSEALRKYFGFPEQFTGMGVSGWKIITEPDAMIEILTDEGETLRKSPGEALRYHSDRAFRGYRRAWRELRPYILNTLIVCGASAVGVLILASITAYILSRYRFAGSKVIFFYFVCTMMFPGVLTLVPSFLLVKNLGLLNSYWVLILPFVAGGQVFAIFVFKSFFDGLPEDLFESARIDGAGHWGLYWNIVLPLSKPIMSVVLVMNVLGTWNNFLWPFIVNNDERYFVLASGLFVLSRSDAGQDMALALSAFVISSVPLLILFIYATKPFVEGVTSGAFKA